MSPTHSGSFSPGEQKGKLGDKSFAMKRIIVLLLTIVPYLSTQAQTAGAPAESPDSRETPAQHNTRMAWWREARFGMFIHWGLYSEAAGYWDGKPTDGAGEWIMTDMRIPLTAYTTLAPKFDPVKFDAEQWAETAQAAGLKYLVITSKHHEGFCMFRTKATSYNVVDDTPWHKDPLLALSKACRRHDIKFCVYYSIMDWHSPDQVPAKLDPDHPAYNPTSFAPDKKAAYVQYMKTELKELITQYHPGLIWFDGQWMNGWTDQEGQDLYRYLLSLDPDLIVNNRVKGAGDYETPEQYIPPNGLPGHDWETCMTMNHTWGFKRDDHDWKSTQTLIRNLVDIASKGGNYLLNVGPTGEGLIPEASVERLQEIGDWMKVNGVGVYGTTASPFTQQLPWGRCTTKISGDTTTLYLHVFDWPADGHLFVPGLGNSIESARLLAGGQKLAWENRQDGVVISVPATAPDKISSTVVLKFKGAPAIAGFKLSTEPAGSLMLDRQSAQAITVSVEPTGGFDRPVKLSVSGLPEALNGSFDPASVDGSGVSTLTLMGADKVVPGAYAMTISAESGALKTSATLNLILTNAMGNNVTAIFNQGNAVTGGGFDMNNYAYNSTTLGDSAAFDGTTMKIGAANEMDAWSQTTVPISGHGPVLKILAAAANGLQMAQVFTVHYTDGTSQGFTQDLSDWCASQNFKGETKVVSVANRLGSNGNADGTGAYLYGYSFPIDDGKTLQSLTLPENRNVVVLSIAVGASAPQN